VPPTVAGGFPSAPPHVNAHVHGNEYVPPTMPAFPCGTANPFQSFAGGAGGWRGPPMYRRFAHPPTPGEWASIKEQRKKEREEWKHQCKAAKEVLKQTKDALKHDLQLKDDGVSKEDRKRAKEEYKKEHKLLKEEFLKGRRFSKEAVKHGHHAHAHGHHENEHAQAHAHLHPHHFGPMTPPGLYPHLSPFGGVPPHRGGFGHGPHPGGFGGPHHGGPHGHFHPPHPGHFGMFHGEGESQKLVARHVKDVTIEDGMQIAAGTPFVKTWRVRNEGAPWPAGCSLLFVSKHGGDNMGGPESVPVPVGGPVVTNQEVDISVHLVAPPKAGRYTGFWKLATPEGRKFGQRLWVTVIVPSFGSSSESEQEADKFEALVDTVLDMGFAVKRHRVFRLLHKYDGSIERVCEALTEKANRHAARVGASANTAAGVAPMTTDSRV